MKNFVTAWPVYLDLHGCAIQQLLMLNKTLMKYVVVISIQIYHRFCVNLKTSELCHNIWGHDLSKNCRNGSKNWYDANPKTRYYLLSVLQS